MKELSLFTALIAMAAAPAHAQTYGKLFGGVVFGGDHEPSAALPAPGDLETETGFGVGGALGYQLTDLIAIEGELAYRTNSIDAATIAVFPPPDDPDLNSLSFMANAVFTAPGGYGITPYIGAGAGAARVGGLGHHDVVFAYQAFGGLRTDVTPDMSAGVEYRYFSADDPPYPGLGGGTTIDYATHSVNLVLTHRF